MLIIYNTEDDSVYPLSQIDKGKYIFNKLHFNENFIINNNSEKVKKVSKKKK